MFSCAAAAHKTRRMAGIDQRKAAPRHQMEPRIVCNTQTMCFRQAVTLRYSAWPACSRGDAG